MSSASTADVSQVWPGMDQSFTKEVEDEANSYFQRIYNHPPNPTISIDEVLEMLKKFKDSPVKKERVSTRFPCHLIDTFRFYDEDDYKNKISSIPVVCMYEPALFWTGNRYSR